MNSKLVGQRRLRRPTVFLLAAALIALLLAGIHTLPIPNSIKLIRDLADFGHAPVFAVIAIACLYMAWTRHGNGTDSPTAGDYAIALLAVVLFASASELAQLGFAGRSASLVDLSRDLLGGLLGLSYCLWRYNRIGIGPLRLLVAAAVIVIVILSAPILWTIAGYVNRDARWPAIVALNSPLDLIFLHPFKSQIRVISSSRTSNDTTDYSRLLIHLNEKLRSGIMVEGLSSDWTDYRRICTDIANPNKVAINVTLWLGNRTSIVRSTSIFQYSQTMPAESRLSSCNLFLTENDSRSSDELDEEHDGYRSLGLTVQPNGVSQDLIVHRIWLE